MENGAQGVEAGKTAMAVIQVRGDSVLYGEVFWRQSQQKKSVDGVAREGKEESRVTHGVFVLNKRCHLLRWEAWRAAGWGRRSG